MRASYNDTSGLIDVSYTGSCNATNHTIYYGNLSDVSTYDYSGAACFLGCSGTTSFDPAGASDAFFVIVGNTGTVEGTYGLDGEGAERPEDTATAGCDLPRDLSGTCDSP
jgi:hypothetical protein